MRIFPVMCASALHNIGTDLILELHRWKTCRRPIEREPRSGRGGWHGNHPQIAESDPCSLYVFKTTADPFAGRITFFKVMSGIVKNDANLQNVTRSTAERLAHLSSPQGKTCSR